ncbi:hypothetical protein BBOR36S_05034 [Brevibacillus borstelensis]|jgi:hypothetical protein
MKSFILSVCLVLGLGIGINGVSGEVTIKKPPTVIQYDHGVGK